MTPAEQQGLRALGARNKPINLLGSMGVTPKNPNDNLQSPAKTLPKNQTKPLGSGPVDTSSFTPEQLSAYNSAKALAPASSTNPAPGSGAPGSTNSMGTHIMTQAELDAQNASRGITQTNPAPPQQNASTANSGASGGTSQYSSTNPVSYPGLIQQAANVASQPSADYLKQQQQANQYNEALKQSRMNEAGGLAANASNPIPLEFQQGRARVMQDQYAQEQAALGSAFQGASTLQGAANTQQGLQQTGLLGAAAGAAPQLGAIGSQQYYNPLNTGQSGGGTLPQQAQDAVNSYAQQVRSGAMTRADAESRLSAYGVTGTNALNAALGANFNTNASNASAGTTAQGQQIQTAAASTNAALDTLGSAFANLNPAQTAGIPATNAIANWIGQQFGDQALTQFRTNLADARSQLIGVLNSSGGTPTGNEATAYQYLPDNMTKAQFDANVGTAQHPGIVRQLVAQKVAAFTQSGQQPPAGSSGGGSTSGFGWNG